MFALDCYGMFKLFPEPLKRKLGGEFCALWYTIFLILMYNVLYNYTLAILVKPGSVKDLIKVEKIRNQAKQRPNKKLIQEFKLDKDERY